MTATPSGEGLFSRVQNGDVTRRFGQIVANQLQNAIALDGEIRSYGDHLFYSSYLGGFVLSYDRTGALRFAVRTLTYLIADDGASTVGEMAEHIAAVENDTTVQQISSYERKRVYVGLYQNHLPMMDNVGVLEYDKNRGTVQLRACATQLEPYLELTDEPNTSRLIAGSALAFSGIPLLSVLDVAPIGALGVPLWIAVGAIGLFSLALLDTYGAFR